MLQPNALQVSPNLGSSDWGFGAKADFTLLCFLVLQSAW